ncbi:MAG: alkaline phosphatase family protein, partial [Saprospiraceae bacterium]
MSNQKIKNVFILMLENHSFDNVFGLSGIPGINGVVAGKNSNSYGGKIYPVGKPAPDWMPSDPGHEFMDTLQQLCGQDDKAPVWKYGDPYPPPGNTIDNLGFAASYATSVSEQTKIIHYSPPPATDIGDVMLCFDTQKQLPAMYALATQFAICDNWYSSIPGPTWPNRFFAYAASSNGLDDSPTMKQQMVGEFLKGFSFPNGSVFEYLKTNKLKYRLYQDRYTELSFPIVQALEGIHWSEMNDISTFA